MYTNSELNIQNIKLISLHLFFYREYYLQWRSHIGLWQVFGSYFSSKHCVLICDDNRSKKEKCPLFHYSHLLFKCIWKRIPGNGVESEDHSIQGRCTLFHGLCPCTPYWKNLLERGCLKGLVVAKLVLSSFSSFVHTCITRSACASTG